MKAGSRRKQAMNEAEPVRVLGRGLRAQRGVHLPLRILREGAGKTQVEVAPSPTTQRCSARHAPSRGPGFRPDYTGKLRLSCVLSPRLIQLLLLVVPAAGRSCCWSFLPLRGRARARSLAPSACLSALHFKLL